MHDSTAVSSFFNRIATRVIGDLEREKSIKRSFKALLANAPSLVREQAKDTQREQVRKELNEQNKPSVAKFYDRVSKVTVTKNANPEIMKNVLQLASGAVIIAK